MIPHWHDGHFTALAALIGDADETLAAINQAYGEERFRHMQRLATQFRVAHQIIDKAIEITNEDHPRLALDDREVPPE